MIRYVDTSAALKLVVDEAESDAVAANLTTSSKRGDHLVASMLLHTELHCAARRRGLDAEAVRTVLDVMTLIDIVREDLLRASSSAWGLRSADAIHLATALRLDVDDLVTDDAEMQVAAREAGLRVTAPPLRELTDDAAGG